MQLQLLRNVLRIPVALSTLTQPQTASQRFPQLLPIVGQHQLVLHPYLSQCLERVEVELVEAVEE
jgi:hypothetical protein